MKILQINTFKFNNNNKKTEKTGPNSILPKYGIKLKPQIKQDTVSFTAIPINKATTTIPWLIHGSTVKSTIYSSDQCRELLKLAKYGLNCPVCGRLLLDWDKYGELEKRITSTTNPAEMIGYMKELKEYLHPTEAKIFEILEFENQKNPQKTLHDILKSYLPESEKRLVELQSSILAYIGILSRGMPNTEYKNVINLLQETFARLIDPRETSRFSRKIFISKLKDIFIPDDVKGKIRLQLVDEYWRNIRATIRNTEDYVNNRLVQVIQNWEYTPEQERILEAASQLPTADNVDAFIVKYSKRKYGVFNPDKSIVLRMFGNSLVTAEHIVPQSNGGKTESKNISLLCASCNSNRASDSLLYLIAENPTMPAYYKRYIKRLYQLAQKGLIDEECIKGQNKTYEEQSLGMLSINPSAPKKKERNAIKNYEDYDSGITPSIVERRAKQKAKRKNVKSKKKSCKSSKNKRA